MPALVHHVKEETNVHATQLEWHGHNDYYYAVANSTAAWLHGYPRISGELIDGDTNGTIEHFVGIYRIINIFMLQQTICMNSWIIQYQHHPPGDW